MQMRMKEMIKTVVKMKKVGMLKVEGQNIFEKHGIFPQASKNGGAKNPAKKKKERETKKTKIAKQNGCGGEMVGSWSLWTIFRRK